MTAVVCSTGCRPIVYLIDTTDLQHALQAAAQATIDRMTEDRPEREYRIGTPRLNSVDIEFKVRSNWHTLCNLDIAPITQIATDRKA